MALAKEKGELFKTLNGKNKVINALQQVTESWRQAMEDMKADTIKSKTIEELLTQENRLLKQQEGEDEDMLVTYPTGQRYPGASIASIDGIIESYMG